MRTRARNSISRRISRRVDRRIPAFGTIVSLLLTNGFDAFGETTEKAFWEGKPAITEKLRDERAVLVSVRTSKGKVDPEADYFTINGVGWVRRSPDKVFSLAQDFERLKDVSEVFREVKFNSKENKVFVIAQSMGYQARMLFRVTTSPAPVREIQFKVVEGHFLGLEGTMGFRDVGAGQTEVSLRVKHEAREIPIPRSLVGFALEVLVQKIAYRMREHFEGRL